MAHIIFIELYNSEFISSPSGNHWTGRQTAGYTQRHDIVLVQFQLTERKPLDTHTDRQIDRQTNTQLCIRLQYLLNAIFQKKKKLQNRIKSICIVKKMRLPFFGFQFRQMQLLLIDSARFTRHSTALNTNCIRFPHISISFQRNFFIKSFSLDMINSSCIFPPLIVHFYTIFSI